MDNYSSFYVPENPVGGYIDMSESILCGDLLLRMGFMRKSNVRPLAVHNINVAWSVGRIRHVSIKVFDDDQYPDKYILYSPANNVGISSVVFNKYLDSGKMDEMSRLSLMIDSVIQKIASNTGVKDRWLGVDSPVTVANLVLFLNTYDYSCDARSSGLALNGRGYRCDRFGDWLLSCIRERVRRNGGDFSLRLFLEAMVSLACCADNLRGEMLVHIEGWFVFGGCDSCLRKVLRQLDFDGSYRMPCIYSFWETRHGERPVTVDGVSFSWAYEPHSNAIPVGSVISRAGNHDYLVMSSNVRYVTVRIQATVGEVMEIQVMATVTGLTRVFVPTVLIFFGGLLRRYGPPGIEFR